MVATDPAPAQKADLVGWLVVLGWQAIRGERRSRSETGAHAEPLRHTTTEMARQVCGLQLARFLVDSRQQKSMAAMLPPAKAHVHAAH